MKDDVAFASWVSEAILNELRPATLMGRLLFKKRDKLFEAAQEAVNQDDTASR